MDNLFPDKDKVFPNKFTHSFSFVKNLTKNPRIQIGDYTYFDKVTTEDELMSHIHQFFPYFDDKLIIGKFCQIAEGVNFIMNAANHRLDWFTTYPFSLIGGKYLKNIEKYAKELPNKGDIVIGNDVWIGQNATILPGVTIDDGSVIGANSTVARDIPAYCVAVGNPAKVIKKRFDDEIIQMLKNLKWWDKPFEQIDKIIPILTCSDKNKAKEELKNLYKNKLQLGG